MPNSGSAPYTLTASFDNVDMLSSGDYTLSLTSGVSASFCPSFSTGGVNFPDLVASLIATGSAVYNTSVPVGSCRSFNLFIRSVDSNEVVSPSHLVVDNMAE